MQGEAVKRRIKEGGYTLLLINSHIFTISYLISFSFIDFFICAESERKNGYITHIT